MKPERLIIQAFGSFADRQEIDFRQFGDHPMILINGPTGAGKSTILDAICFALYGQTSGDDRDASQMRAQYANSEMLSEIEFDFSLGTSRYRVRRVPQQKRPKKRGEGETDHNAEAQVWKLDADEAQVVVNRGMVQATAYIESLMGLNADQFRQVMVLPQGKFRELLIAKSTDREKIFSTLFNSGIYKRIEDALKAQAKALEVKLKSSSDQVAGQLKLVEMDSESSLINAINELLPIVSQLDTNRQHANEKLVQANQTLEKAQSLVKTFENVQRLQREIVKLETTAKTLIPDREILKKANTALHLLPKFQLMERSAKAVQSRLAEIKKQTDLVEQLSVQVEQSKLTAQEFSAKMESAKDDKQTVSELNQLLKLHEALTPRFKSMETARSTLKDVEHNHKLLSEQLDKTKSELTEQEKTLERDRLAIEKLNELQLSLSTKLSLVDARKAYDSNHVEINRYRQKIDDGKPVLLAASIELDKEVRDLSELELQWHSGAAATLAAQLGKDNPCPVCGSTDHPDPARVDQTHGLIEHAQVESARSKLEQHRREYQTLQNRQNQWQQESERLSATNEELMNSNAGLVDSDLKTLQQHLKEQQAACAELLSVKEKIPEMENAIKQIRKKQKTLEENVVAAVARQSEAAALFQSSTTEYENALAAIPEVYRDRAILQSKIDALIEQLNKLEKDQIESEKKLQDKTLEYTETASALKRMESELQRERKIQASAEEDWIARLAESVFSDVDEYKRACISEQEANAIKDRLDAHEKDLNKTRGELAASIKLIESKTPPDIAALTAIVTELKVLSTTAEERWQKERDRLKQLQDVRKSIEKSLGTTAKLRADHEKVGYLSNVTSGQDGTRISLQRFVLSVLLDDVLLDATRRMLLMSSNRYQLVRREESGGRRAAGLELDVFDTYSGKTRPVSTLSGGESFQAALALALGLSDVVQSYSGGIRLDTLFIDEGFGSLDTDALELAIKTLTDLQSAGRTIGVISHVTEMKEQITQRLDIRPSPTGSQIYAVCQV